MTLYKDYLPEPPDGTYWVLEADPNPPKHIVLILKKRRRMFGVPIPGNRIAWGLVSVEVPARILPRLIELANEIKKETENSE